MGATDEISKQLLDDIEELANLEPYFEILKSSSLIIFDPLITTLSHYNYPINQDKSFPEYKKRCQ